MNMRRVWAAVAVVSVSATACGQEVGALSDPQPTLAPVDLDQPNLGRVHLECADGSSNGADRDGFEDDGDRPRNDQAALRREIRERPLDVEFHEFVKIRSEQGHRLYVYEREGRRLAAFEVVKFGPEWWEIQTELWCVEVDHIFGYGGAG